MIDPPRFDWIAKSVLTDLAKQFEHVYNMGLEAAAEERAELLAALRAINIYACYTQEDASPENREAMLQQIGATARAAMSKGEGIVHVKA